MSHAAIETISALMCPLHDNYDLKMEQLNKTSLLSSKAFLESLLAKLNEHVSAGTGALVVAGFLDFLTFALCEPFSETTEGQAFERTLALVAGSMRNLFVLFQHPSLAIGKSAGMIATLNHNHREEVKWHQGCQSVNRKTSSAGLRMW